MLSLKRFFIDTSRAKDFWPKQITSLDELPTYYHDFVKDWLQQGMPLTNIILVKQRNKWEDDRPEYAIAQYHDRVMLLHKTPYNQVVRTVVSGADVISVEYNHIYLDCTVIITFLQNEKFHKTQFHFNAAAENLYVSILNILLKNKIDYLENVGTHENSVCNGLMEKSYLMFNCGKLAYRLDDKIESYFWDKIETKAQKKKNKKTKKRKSETEFFIAMMKKGTATIISSEDHLSATYLFWNSIRQITLNFDELKGHSILLTTIANDCFSIPVQQENCADAEQFISQCNTTKNDLRKAEIKKSV